MQTPQKLLDYLNTTFVKLHKKHEDYFWTSYMGDHSVDSKKDEALSARDTFYADPKNIEKINELMPKADAKTKKRLQIWLDFFIVNQTPKEALTIKEKIATLESNILKMKTSRKEGYIDPKNKKFVAASSLKMSTMITTNDDEKIRKACFEAREKLAQDYLTEYLELIGLRNQFAKSLGYTDFYDYKVQKDDGMTKKELFSIFDDIYEKTKFAKQNIRNLEKNIPGLRKPWNFAYKMSGDFTKEENPYYQFDDALIRWGRSFSALGIDMRGGKIQLDLLNRQEKYNNGFCHWPDITNYKNGKRISGSSNFTCNVVNGQIGSGVMGYATLFHEGGHAAHFLNAEQAEACLNTEYAPMSASWAETQSMLIDSLFSSVEWQSRYASNKQGELFPFELYERRINKLFPLRPIGLYSMVFVSNFEKEIYEEKNLTKEKVLAIAKKNYKKYFDRSEDSLSVLNGPHIYSWESSASYHGYALATLALNQWKEYFYKKYGYIVDNPKVGKDMAKVWKLGSSKKFNEFVVLATGKKLTADAYLNEVTVPMDKLIKRSKDRIAVLEKVKPYIKPINLNASIKMVHGKTDIADNKKSFEDMADKYRRWLNSELKDCK